MQNLVDRIEITKAMVLEAAAPIMDKSEQMIGIVRVGNCDQPEL